MSGPRKFYGSNRNTKPYERVNPKYVPPSRHAIFIRGFPNDLDTSKIRDFFQESSKSNVGIDFTSFNDDQRKLSIALRFDSHDVAKETLQKFNNSEIFGYRVEISWFKDLKKARDRMLDEKRSYDERMNHKNKFDYDRRENRDVSDRKRMIPTNNRRRSQSRERSDANSDISIGGKKRRASSDERSRSRSSNRSQRSYSGSDSRSIVMSKLDQDHKSPLSLKTLVKERPINDSIERPAAYTVDLDEDDIVVPIKKEKESSVTSMNDKFKMEATNHKHDSEDKKKKKKKRKRRRMEVSESQDSLQDVSKMQKVIQPSDYNEGHQFAAIAGDMNNWKANASDSDDPLIKTNSIIKSKAPMPTSGLEKLNTDKNVKLMKLKVESIEKAYKKDCETYTSVVGVLIRTYLLELFEMYMMRL